MSMPMYIVQCLFNRDGCLKRQRALLRSCFVVKSLIEAPHPRCHRPPLPLRNLVSATPSLARRKTIKIRTNIIFVKKLIMPEFCRSSGMVVLKSSSIKTPNSYENHHPTIHTRRHLSHPPRPSPNNSTKQLGNDHAAGAAKLRHDRGMSGSPDHANIPPRFSPLLEHHPPLRVVMRPLAGIVEEVVLLAGWDGWIRGEAVAPFGEFVGVALFGTGDGIFVDLYA